MMTSQIMTSVDFTITQKSRYLQNETLFLLQIKIFINCASRATLWEKNNFVVEVTFNNKALAAHDFLKVSLIEAFITAHNFDIICLWETFLDSTVSQHDENITINGYSLLRADHPRNSKRGGVCLYFKEHLPFIRRNDIAFCRNVQ